MKKFVLLAWLFAPALMAQTGAITGFCNNGASQAAVSGLQSTNYQQGMIPSCTVSVYLTGTTTLATIYADKNNGVLGNPFTATTAGQWLFFAATSTGYDVTLSGGISPNTYPVPVTLTAIYAAQQISVVSGAGGANTQAQYNNNGTLAGSLATLDAAGNVNTPGSVTAASANVSGTVTAGKVSTGSLLNSGWQPSGIDALGDSTCQGDYADNTATGNAANGFTFWLSQMAPGGANIICTGGSMMPDVGQVQLFPLGTFAYGSAPQFVLQDGLNDQVNYGLNVNQQAIFQATHLAVLTRALIPQKQTIEADSGLITRSSGWTLNATRIGSLAPTIESVTNGNTLSIPITTTGGPIYVSYEQVDGNAGAAGVTIDGTSTGITLNSGNAGTAGNCICTSHSTVQAPFAARFPVLAGAHTVLLTVTGATGAGTGFSFISAGTTGTGNLAGTPVAGGAPVLWEGGITRTESYPSDNTDLYDGFLHANIATLQGDGLNANYICGLAGDYASYAECSGVSGFYLSNYKASISTTAYDSATGLLTVVATAPVTGIVAGQKVTVSGVTTKTALNTTALWSVQSVSGSTIILAQAGFSAVTWTTLADTGQVAPDMYNAFHPNSQGYYKMFLAYQNQMKLSGGGPGSILPEPLGIGGGASTQSGTWMHAYTCPAGVYAACNGLFLEAPTGGTANNYALQTTGEILAAVSSGRAGLYTSASLSPAQVFSIAGPGNMNTGNYLSYSAGVGGIQNNQIDLGFNYAGGNGSTSNFGFLSMRGTTDVAPMIYWNQVGTGGTPTSGGNVSINHAPVANIVFNVGTTALAGTPASGYSLFIQGPPTGCSTCYAAGIAGNVLATTTGAKGFTIQDTADTSGVTVAQTIQPNLTNGSTTSNLIAGVSTSANMGLQASYTSNATPANALGKFLLAGATVALTIDSSGNIQSGGALKVASGRKGTFVCTAGGTITISNANEAITSTVVITLNAVGGTPLTPTMKTVTAATGFTVLCGAADTSTYNYTILD